VRQKGAYLAMHLLADVTNVGKDGLLVSFSEQLRGCDGVALPTSA